MIKIAISRQSTDYTTDIELDGTEYKYRIYWHNLYDRWYMDLLDITGQPLVTGKKITLGVPMFRHRKLKGDFFVISRTEDDTPPGIKDLGERVNIFYLSEQEINRTVRLREQHSLADFFNLII
jgi:hypothetical protein